MKKRKIYLCIKNTFWFKEGDLLIQANRPKYVGSESHWLIGREKFMKEKTIDEILSSKERKDGTAVFKGDVEFIGYL